MFILVPRSEDGGNKVLSWSLRVAVMEVVLWWEIKAVVAKER